MIIIVNVLSLFSGAGGLDLGFYNADFNIIKSLEIDEDCCKTLEKNFKHKIICDDINNVKFNNQYYDVVIGGTPCQDLSNANRVSNSKIIFSPKNKHILKFIHIIKKIKPLVFVFENVPQVINSKFVNEFINELDNYHIEIKVLNAEEYGVAQRRNRAFFIGSRIGEIKHPESLKEKYIVKDAFKNLNENIPNQLDYSKPREQTKEKIKCIPPGGNWESLPGELKGKRNKSKTHSVYMKRLDYNKPSVTILNFRKNMILHPEEDRIISVREGARLQGFPDWYIFEGKLASKQQMVANAVPVTVAQMIAKQIYNKLTELHIELEINY